MNNPKLSRIQDFYIKLILFSTQLCVNALLHNNGNIFPDFLFLFFFIQEQEHVEFN